MCIELLGNVLFFFMKRRGERLVANPQEETTGKNSRRKDPNGLTGGWPLDRGINHLLVELRLIKGFLLKPWKSTLLNLTQEQEPEARAVARDLVPHQEAATITNPAATSQPLHLQLSLDRFISGQLVPGARETLGMTMTEQLIVIHQTHLA